MQNTSIAEFKTKELETRFELFLNQYKHKEILSEHNISKLFNDIDIYRKCFMNLSSKKSIYLLSILNSFQDSIVQKKKWIDYKKFFLLCSKKFYLQFQLISKSIIFINYALRLKIPLEEKISIYYCLIFFLRVQKKHKLASSYTFVLYQICKDPLLYDTLLQILHKLDMDMKQKNGDNINVKLIAEEKQTLETVFSTIKDFI
ncbi:MAG: hypothetical protein ISQ46_03860 [Methylophilaceae bacterium]|nr:hypothetical protein [Methylophilaceae bacterium]